MAPLRRACLVAVAVLATACISAARQEKAASRVTLGSAYLREGNLPSAITTLEEAARLDRRNWSAWNKLGLAYMAAGAYDQADEAFVKALDLVPEEAEALTNRGSLLIRAGRAEEAIEPLSQAAASLTYRKPAVALSNLGYAYHQLGRYSEALASLDAAIRRAPNLCQARFVRGLVYRAVDETDRALDDFDVVIQLCGEEASGAYLQAGELLVEQGRRDDGCTYLLTALQEAGSGALSDAARAAHRGSCS